MTHRRGTRTLAEVASVIRSKNAGPFEITFDVMFDDASTYDAVKRSGVWCPALIARLYSVDPARVLGVFAIDAALSLKATIARPVSSGSVGDTDVFGSQQDAPLLNVAIAWDETDDGST